MQLGSRSALSRHVIVGSTLVGQKYTVAGDLLPGWCCSSKSSKLEKTGLLNANDLDRLDIPGSIISRVASVSSTFTNDIADSVVTTQEWLSRVADAASEAFSLAGITIHHSLGTTLVAGQCLAGATMEIDDGALFEKFKQYLNSGEQLSSRSNNSAEQVSADVLGFEDGFHRTCLNRCFFTTSSGLIGIGPSKMQPSDNLVVLQGGRWPFVLRGVGNEYVMLGPSYVYGIIRGEAWKGNDSEDVQIVKIR